MNWTDFLELVQKRKREWSWREGQAFFNTLEEVRPELADLVRGTGFDPFFDDRILYDFVIFIFVRWNNEKS